MYSDTIIALSVKTVKKLWSITNIAIFESQSWLFKLICIENRYKFL